MTLAALHQLYRKGELDVKVVAKAIEELGIDPDKANPLMV